MSNSTDYILRPGTELQGGKYVIGRKLGQGGFGITYLAMQTMLGRDVAIKEFFLKDYCVRKGGTSVSVTAETQADMVGRYKDKFIKEARILARFDHPGIVRVLDVFQENGTWYYAMDYVVGRSIRAMIDEEGCLPEQEALGYIRKVARALEYIHGLNVNHLDIKPSNIMVRRRDNEPILIDFGISKQYDEKKDETSKTPPGISKGYSPMEQYKSGGVSTFSPQADIYALGATLYAMLTGKTPPEAPDVMNDGLPEISGVSAATKAAIQKAMQPKRADRPRTVAEFVAMLPKETSDADSDDTVPAGESVSDDTVPAGESVSDDDVKVVRTKPPKRTGPGKYYMAAIAMVVLAIAIGAIFGARGCGNADSYNIDDDTAAVAADSDRAVIDNLVANMVYVAGGTFTMGATSEQGDRALDDEKPAHRVTLSGFSIGKYEVTQAEWQAVMGSNPSGFKGESLPVENVSWDDCREFIRKLNGLTGKSFRLPTEAEWEYAARGGGKSCGYKYSGSNNIGDVAWYYYNSGGKTHAVGQKRANELGLYDMSGNVWEWCQDWYGSYGSSAQTNPAGPASNSDSNRVIRGGSWFIGAGSCRVSDRGHGSPSNRYPILGLRLAL